MTKNARNYLIFALVLAAVTISAVLSFRYLHNVRIAIEQDRAAAKPR